jgi:hypothetical protein
VIVTSGGAFFVRRWGSCLSVLLMARRFAPFLDGALLTALLHSVNLQLFHIVGKPTRSFLPNNLFGFHVCETYIHDIKIDYTMFVQNNNKGLFIFGSSLS